MKTSSACIQNHGYSTQWCTLSQYFYTIDLFITSMTTQKDTTLTLFITTFENALRTLFAKSIANRPSPALSEPATTLSTSDKALSGALMRVNHVGEVCAQALYAGQALMTQDPILRKKFNGASKEEGDHLAWTKQRLDELGARTSLLNPLWYAASFGLGVLAGSLGDKVSLGFVVETERQVEVHLEDHMARLPNNDHASRAIVARMKVDEARHADEARALGTNEVPMKLKVLMYAASKVMTTVAHRV